MAGMAVSCRRLLASTLCSLVVTLAAANTYHVGDYVPVARQAQFHAMRTHWHDLIGRHCPRFGMDREVVLPIPRPIGFSFNDDSYKLKLSFGKERFVTGWLLIMSKANSITPPVINVQLSHFAGEFRGVHAKLAPLPQKYLMHHQELILDWSNQTRWPKHVILQYHWKEHAELDVTAGLFLLFGTSFALTTMLAIYILQSSKDKLARFMNEQLSEAHSVPTGLGAAAGSGVPKVD